jgi:hypothetical protein
VLDVVFWWCSCGGLPGKDGQEDVTFLGAFDAQGVGSGAQSVRGLGICNVSGLPLIGHIASTGLQRMPKSWSLLFGISSALQPCEKASNFEHKGSTMRYGVFFVPAETEERECG